jgi:hypothetical protein
MTGRTKPLLVVVDGTVDPLERALKAGKTTLADFGKSAGDAVAEVQRKMREAAANPAPIVESLQKSVQAQIQAARAAANAALSDSGGARTAKDSLAAAEAIEKLAQAERNRSAAAVAASAADERQAAGLKIIAVGAASSADALEDQAAALRDQAALLSAVEAEQVKMGTATVESGRQITGTTGAMRAGFQQAGFQVSDFVVQVTGGTSAIRAASLQAPQLIQALALMGGEAEGANSKFSRFAGILNGPWGAAITVGVSLLGLLATGLLDSEDAAEKASDQTYDFGQSLDFLALKADDALAAMKQLVGETERLVKIQGNLDRQVAANAERALADAKTRLSNAEKRLAEIENAPGLSNRVEELFTKGDAQREVDTARQILAEAERAAQNAQLGLSQRAVVEGRDPFARDLRQIGEEQAEFNRRRLASQEVERFDPRIRNFELAKRNAIYISEEEYKDETKRLEDLREKVEKAKQDAERAPSAASGRGNGNALGGAKALLEELFPGVRITSTNDGKHVKGSDHYAGRAIDFVPAGGINSIPTDEVLRRIEEAGITVRRNARGTKQFFGPGRSASKPGDHDDHFHLAFEGSPSPEDADRAAAQRAEKAKRDREALDQALLASKEDAVRLARVGVTDAAKLAELDIAAIDAGLARKLAQNAKLELDTKELDALDTANAEIEKRAVTERLRADLAERALNEERRQISIAAQLVELEGQLATSTRQKKRAAEQLLELRYQDEKKAAEQQLDRDLQDGNPNAIAAYLDNLGIAQTRKQVDQKRLSEDFRGPTGDYMAELRANVDDMDEAFDGIAARGLQSLEDGLVGLISGTENVATAFKRMAASIIADLARIAVQKLILSAFGIGFKEGNVPGFAGGMISGPGTGTSDSILAFHETMGPIRVSNGESIITAEGTRKHRKLLKAINDNTLPAFAGGMVPSVSYPAIPSAAALRAPSAPPAQYFDLRGAVVTEELYRQMHQIGAAHAARALAASPAMAMEEMAQINSQRIPA